MNQSVIGNYQHTQTASASNTLLKLIIKNKTPSKKNQTKTKDLQKNPNISRSTEKNELHFTNMTQGNRIMTWKK